MVARGAGAAGPVLLACRQWDPLGLARRLPSLGVGAWRSAPLLPWRAQCAVRVCAALAAGLGDLGRYLVFCLSRFPLPVPRCVWRAVQSGCPLPSLAGTPFHPVCAFRVLGPVAYLVVPACPLRVCALALPRRPLPLPLSRLACSPRAVPALGAGRAVPRGPCPSACPAPVPCSVWRAWAGTVRSRFPPTWLRVVGPAEGHPRGGCPPLLCHGGGGGPSLGGATCHRCEGRLGSGPVPPPAARPLERVARVARPVCPWCGRCGRGDPAPASQLAPLRAGVARCGGGGRKSPWEGFLPPFSGASEVRRCPSPDCPPTGRAFGVRHPRAVGTCVWVWGLNTVPLACMLCGGCVPRGSWGAVPGGLACHRCEGRLLSGAVPPPAAGPLERAARVPRPVCPGCGRCGRGDPAPAPQLAPLRAGVAHCEGGGRASPGGVPATVVRGAWCQALSLPRQPLLWSRQPGFRGPVSRLPSVRAW